MIKRNWNWEKIELHQHIWFAIDIKESLFDRTMLWINAWPIQYVYVIAWGQVELRINFHAYFQSFRKIATRAIYENFENTSENLSLILRGLNAITCL